MRMVRVLLLGLLLAGTLGSAAQAAYVSGYDKTVSLTLAPSLVSTSGSTGTATFALQESAHDALTDTTGAEVDHYYFWVDVNGQPVLAVDPAWADVVN